MANRIPLNIHLWIDIFENLDVNSLKACKLTCKLFNCAVKLVRKCELLISFSDCEAHQRINWFWMASNPIAAGNQLFFCPFDGAEILKCLLAFLATPMFQNIQKLKLVLKELYYPQSFYQNGFKAFLSDHLVQFLKLKHLEIFGGACDRTEGISEIKVFHPTLQIFHFELSSFVNDEYHFDFPSCTHFKFLVYNDPLNLTDRTRTNIRHFSTNLFQALGDNLPAVEELELIMFQRLNKETLKRIRSYNNLKRLFLKVAEKDLDVHYFDYIIAKLQRKIPELPIFLGNFNLLITKEMLEKGCILDFLELIEGYENRL